MYGECNTLRKGGTVLVSPRAGSPVVFHHSGPKWLVRHKAQRECVPNPWASVARESVCHPELLSQALRDRLARILGLSCFLQPVCEH